MKSHNQLWLEVGNALRQYRTEHGLQPALDLIKRFAESGRALDIKETDFQAVIDQCKIPPAIPKKAFFPPELESYRRFIFNTGGTAVEDLLFRLDTQPKLSITNMPVFIMAVSVEAQVNLLKRLYAEGKLTEGPAV